MGYMAAALAGLGANGGESSFYQELLDDVFGVQEEFLLADMTDLFAQLELEPQEKQALLAQQLTTMLSAQAAVLLTGPTGSKTTVATLASRLVSGDVQMTSLHA